MEVGNAIGGFLLVAFMFGLIYRVMPRLRVLVADVWLGALLAALLFTGGKYISFWTIRSARPGLRGREIAPARIKSALLLRHLNLPADKQVPLSQGKC